MKRSIPLRGSVGASDTSGLLGLTEGQRKAVAQMQSWEAASEHERALLYLDSVLETEDRLEAARLLRRLSENSRSADLWWLFGSIASDIEKGENLVEVLRQAQENYNLIETWGREKPRKDRGQK